MCIYIYIYMYVYVYVSLLWCSDWGEATPGAPFSVLGGCSRRVERGLRIPVNQKVLVDTCRPKNAQAEHQTGP